MRLCTLILGVMLAFLASALAKPPVSKAKVEEPVLQELMGGCSLRCGFAWRVDVQPAGGGKAGAVRVLNDENADTAWIAPEGTSGVGTKLKLLFPKKLRALEEGEIPIYGLDLINGDWKTEEQWKARGRVKRARLYYNSEPFCEVLFADSRRWQRITFADFMVRSGDAMTLEILEIYRGKTAAGAAITEIVLQGAH